MAARMQAMPQLSGRAQPGSALLGCNERRRYSGSAQAAGTRTTGKIFLAPIDSQVQVPILAGQQNWGDSSRASSRLVAAGWRGYVQDARIELVVRAHVAVLAFRCVLLNPFAGKPRQPRSCRGGAHARSQVTQLMHCGHASLSPHQGLYQWLE